MTELNQLRLEKVKKFLETCKSDWSQEYWSTVVKDLEDLIRFGQTGSTIH